MDLDRVKQLMQQGVSYEKAYGFCMLQKARAENQIPNHKVQEARRSSANFGALRPSKGASDNPEIVKCPVCDGDGLEAVEVFKSQSFSRDTGEPYEELRHCETCDGSGEVMLEDE
jgi:hypothetical protein